jgi:hypothetical protein
MFKIGFNKIMLGLTLLFGVLGLTSVGGNTSVSAVENSSYNSEIESKLISRCSFINEYISQTARINELAARQNKVRGWEFILRRLGEIQQGYEKFDIDYAELAGNISRLRSQLEQFKVDFEAYDREFQRLISINCRNNPLGFWTQLEVVRSFRSGIALASENFTSSFNETLKSEEAKW